MSGGQRAIRSRPLPGLHPQSGEGGSEPWGIPLSSLTWQRVPPVTGGAGYFIHRLRQTVHADVPSPPPSLTSLPPPAPHPTAFSDASSSWQVLLLSSLVVSGARPAILWKELILFFGGQRSSAEALRLAQRWVRINVYNPFPTSGLRLQHSNAVWRFVILSYIQVQCY